jgi:hypothetical protein
MRSSLLARRSVPGQARPHHRRGTGYTDGRGRDAEHGEPSARQGQFLWVVRGLQDDFVPTGVQRISRQHC